MAEDLTSVFKKQTDSTPEPKADATPAETGEKKTAPEDNRTFTQEEVNRIVSDRLAREKAKATQESDREAALTARENALECREFIEKNKEYPAKLLEILDTSNFKDFKDKADKLMEAFPEINQDLHGKMPVFTGPTGDQNTSSDMFAEAFKPRI